MAENVTLIFRLPTTNPVDLELNDGEVIWRDFELQVCQQTRQSVATHITRLIETVTHHIPGAQLAILRISYLR